MNTKPRMGYLEPVPHRLTECRPPLESDIQLNKLFDTYSPGMEKQKIGWVYDAKTDTEYPKDKSDGKRLPP